MYIDIDWCFKSMCRKCPEIGTDALVGVLGLEDGVEGGGSSSDEQDKPAEDDKALNQREIAKALRKAKAEMKSKRGTHHGPMPGTRIERCLTHV
jgi:hypothetical protein